MAKYIDPALMAKELERRRLSTGRLVQWQAAMEAAMVEVPERGRCIDCTSGIRCDSGEVYCDAYKIYVSYDHFCADHERKPTCGEGKEHG